MQVCNRRGPYSLCTITNYRCTKRICSGVHRGWNHGPTIFDYSLGTGDVIRFFMVSSTFLLDVMEVKADASCSGDG